MSFVEKIKYIRTLSVVDEFGGKGDAGKIRKFYIVFRIADLNGSFVSVSKPEVLEAVQNKNIVISDYIGEAVFTTGVLDDNPQNDHFIISDIAYRFDYNILTVKVASFSDDVSISVKFKDGDDVIATTSYLSDIPSGFFLSKKL